MPIAGGPAVTDRAPPGAEALLRAALERLVLLECQPGGRDAEPPAPELLQNDLRRAEDRARAAESKLDRLFGKILAAERVRAGFEREGDPDGDVDLAGFIAELRSELADVQRGRDFAARKNVELSAELRRLQSEARPRSAVEWAERLAREGLLFSPGASLGELTPALATGASAERLLLTGVLRDLASGDPVLQDAACRRLAAVSPAHAAPIVASALGRLREPGLLCKLLRLAGQSGVGSLRPLVERELDHSADGVRAAALWALLRLPGEAEGRGDLLERALEDPSPRVRRAAALGAALSRPDEAPALLDRLAADPEAAVRRLAAGCAAALAEPHESVLRRLGNDEEPAVRAAALRALRRSPRAEAPPRGHADATPDGPPSTAPAAPAAAPPGAELELRIEAELRASLRGRTEAELAALLGLPEAAVARSVERAVRDGRIARRGTKLFLG